MICTLLATVSCKAQPEKPTIVPTSINRFDIALYSLLEADDADRRESLRTNYGDMLNVLGKAVLNIQFPVEETDTLIDRLLSYYSEPTLKSLYHDAITAYDTIADIESELSLGLARLKTQLPTVLTPRIYMHVSGFGQNVLTADNLLSISIDKYMGKSYPLYRHFFSSWQAERMHRGMIVADYLSGWLMSEFPFTGKESVLLERMIYEGKIKYIISLALPDLLPETLLGYSSAGYTWCRKNERMIWKTIIERQHLYTPDIGTTNLYFAHISSSFIADNVPGSLGSWIGLQIIRRYMKETKSTPWMLMNNTDAQDILARSKYKPS
jgi:hypothetical protein